MSVFGEAEAVAEESGDRRQELSDLFETAQLGTNIAGFAVLLRDCEGRSWRLRPYSLDAELADISDP